MSNIHILKFGGTSLQNHSFIKQAVEVVKKRTASARPVVVVSAIGGVTDQLIRLADRLVEQPKLANRQINRLRDLHHNVLSQLVSTTDHRHERVDKLFDDLKIILFDENYREEHPKAWRDHVLSFGERASAHIFTSVLTEYNLKARTVEAQEIVKTDSTFGEANILPELTRKLVKDYFRSLDEIAVVTGFIGSTEEAQITTLGRSGSDYTASLVADALDADHLEIWTDVDGVLTADPKIVPKARHIDQLSYEDISELAAHGAKVIHPKTIRPIKDRDISVQVRNSYNPAHPGTMIHRSFRSNGNFRSITLSGPFVHIEIEDRHAYPLTLLLEEQLGSSTDSEAFSYTRVSRYESASFLIKEDVYGQVDSQINDWTEREGITLKTQRGLYKVKKFANDLLKDENTLVRILNLLAAKNIQPVRINRQKSQRFVSFLLPRKEAFLTARLINDYLLSNQKTVDLFLAGTGAVGGTLLKQLHALETDGIELRLIGLCNSQHVYWDERGIGFDETESLADGDPTDWPGILKKLTTSERYHTIFIDATGSAEVARLYPEILEAGIHIATPSKLANTCDQAYYDKLQKTAEGNNIFYRYETTVGAGLPVLSTLNDLHNSGDQVTEISGVVSGTMTYLFDQLEQGTPFSKAVRKARELGYAEPDPRDDLSGEDVARKFLIMARLLGYKVERDQIEVESLIPTELEQVDQQTFLEKLSLTDAVWEQKLQKAHKKGETLRYTGTLSEGAVKIGIQSVSRNSPVGQLKGTDNLIRIHSRRYDSIPIIIQGPGAGKEVTAAGLLTDILKIGSDITA